MKKIGHLSQIVLYCKGWFRYSDDIFEDLKILISEVYLLDLEHVTIEDIREAMIEICRELGIFDEPYKFSEFMREISPECYFKWTDRQNIKYINKSHPDYDFNRAVICKCKSLLTLLKIKQNGKTKFILKRPNFDLLPHNEKSSLNIDNLEWDDA